MTYTHSSACLGASLVTQLVKNPPAMQEILVQFLGLEDPLLKGKTTHSSILGTEETGKGGQSLNICPSLRGSGGGCVRPGQTDGDRHLADLDKQTKETIKEMKREPTERKKIFANCVSDKGVNI